MARTALHHAMFVITIKIVGVFLEFSGLASRFSLLQAYYHLEYEFLRIFFPEMARMKLSSAMDGTAWREMQVTRLFTKNLEVYNSYCYILVFHFIDAVNPFFPIKDTLRRISEIQSLFICQRIPPVEQIVGFGWFCPLNELLNLAHTFISHLHHEGTERLQFGLSHPF